MNTAHEDNYRRRVADAGPTRFLPGSAIEIVREVDRSAPPGCAIFDFDGTLSLIREGWPEVMVPMMVEVLQQTGTEETAESISRHVREFVMELNGKQTIYQMIRLAEEVAARGGKPDDPLEYKREYHDRLMQRVNGRREALQSGAAEPESMLVPGAREALAALQARGVELYLASGTDVQYVREECELLGLDGYFGPHVYGALDDYKQFSKQMVIEQILRENAVEPTRLIGFGDGYVEIDNVKTAGGTAIAVASDERERSGRPDAWKRERLIGVGADVVIPDFRECEVLFKYLWEER
jgi:phosphoglycolate phosphatase